MRPFARSRSCIASSGSSDCGSSLIPDQGSPFASTRSGTLAIVSSSGWTASISSQRERCRNLGTGAGAHRPGAEDGLVRRVLVVVDEDALAALLLPPGGGEDVGAAALELARGGDRGRAHLVGVPARLEADVDVEAAVAGRLRIADDAELVEQGSGLGGRGADVRKAGAGLRVEVEAQLVGVLGVVGEQRPDVEAEAAEVHRPDHVRRGRRGRARARVVPLGVLTIVVCSQSGAPSRGRASGRTSRRLRASAKAGAGGSRNRCSVEGVGRPPQRAHDASSPTREVSTARGRCALRGSCDRPVRSTRGEAERKSGAADTRRPDTASVRAPRTRPASSIREREPGGPHQGRERRRGAGDDVRR